MHKKRIERNQFKLNQNEFSLFLSTTTIYLIMAVMTL